MSNVSFKSTGIGVKKAVSRFKALTKEVAVGVLGSDGSDLFIATASNEYGTQDGHIPARPFVRPAVRAPELKVFVARMMKSFASGQLSEEAALGMVGEKLRSLIVKNIGSNISPPNAPSTIARKGSSRTLIDTGRMRQSISYEIRKKKYL